MKAKCLKSINAIFVFLLGALGFSGCGWMSVEYGVPHADLDIEGQVLNEENEALSNIQIVARHGWKDGGRKLYWQEYADTFYTNSTGNFHRHYGSIYPLEYHRIIAHDPSGVYASDSIDVTVTYTGGDRHWYDGQATLKIDLVLKKK